MHINKHTLLVENDTSQAGDNELLTTSTEPSDMIYGYGYGLGLFLAEKICQQQQWQLKITSKPPLFKVQVTFYDAQEQSKLD
ncbi:MAG: hypothetical protein ACI9LM_005577 [Alteromonadaceae bacterium]